MRVLTIDWMEFLQAEWLASTSSEAKLIPLALMWRRGRLDA